MSSRKRRPSRRPKQHRGPRAAKSSGPTSKRTTGTQPDTQPDAQSTRVTTPRAPDRRAAGAAPRWPWILVLLGAAIALGGLALARYLTDQRFLYGLIVTGAGLGLAASGLLAAALGRRLFARGIAGLAAAGLGLAAALLRVFLILAQPRPRPGLPSPPIIMWREILVGTPLALGVCALLLGAHVGLRTVNLPPGGLRQPGARLDLVGSILALAGALYALGPLLRSLGLPLNHITFLGLVLLGLVAFALASAVEWLLGRRRTR